ARGHDARIAGDHIPALYLAQRELREVHGEPARSHRLLDGPIMNVEPARARRALPLLSRDEERIPDRAAPFDEGPGHDRPRALDRKDAIDAEPRRLRRPRWLEQRERALHGIPHAVEPFPCTRRAHRHLRLEASAHEEIARLLTGELGELGAGAIEFRHRD